MTDLIDISFGAAALTALLGYLVVFFGLVLLMVVVMIMGKIMVAQAAKAKTTAPAAAAEPAAPAPEELPINSVTSESDGTSALSIGTNCSRAAAVFKK